jgi:hypothetical protein
MSSVKTNRIDPAGTTVVIGGPVSFSAGASFGGGITVGGNAYFGGGVTVGGGGITVAQAGFSVGNVMPKPNNTVSSNLPVVGCALPVFCDFTTTTPIPAGKWFVHLIWQENFTNGDEDIAMGMAKIWTIPSGQYLKIAGGTYSSGSQVIDGSLQGATTNWWYKISTSSGITVPASRAQFNSEGWTEFVVGTNCNNLYVNGFTANGEHSGMIVYGSNSPVPTATGFAMRIG